MLFKFKNKRIKVKKIEQRKLDKGMKAYLIYRYYKKDCLEEYLVCINYQFRSNTFVDGLRFRRLDEAYQIFNYLCNNHNFPNLNEDGNQ